MARRQRENEADLRFGEYFSIQRIIILGDYMHIIYENNIYYAYVHSVIIRCQTTPGYCLLYTVTRGPTDDGSMSVLQKEFNISSSFTLTHSPR